MFKNKQDAFYFTLIKALFSLKVLLSLVLFCYAANTHAISLIVNQSVTASPASSKELRNIFTMQKTYWSNGKKIQVFVFPDNNPLHRQFSKTITKIFPYQYRRIWDRMTFSGTGIAPKTVYNMEEMIKKVSNTKNSIGYIKQPVQNRRIRIINLDAIEENSHE